MWSVKVPRAGAWVVVSLLGVVGILATYPGGVAELFRDLREYRQNAERVRHGDQETREIADRFAVQYDRDQLKVQLRGQLARQEVAIADAADQYLQAMEAAPHLLSPFRRSLPGESDQERAAVLLLREVFDTQPLAWPEQRILLDQFQSRYGSQYPYPLPDLSAGATAD